MSESRSKVRATAWKKGQSGNPAGKKPGARNKATLMVLQLMEGGAEEITRTVLDAARGGDLMAAKFVLDRLAPPMRERPISMTLPDTSTASGIAAAQQTVLLAVSTGDLTPSEASTISGIIDARRRALETEELVIRIEALEEATGKADK